MKTEREVEIEARITSLTETSNKVWREVAILDEELKDLQRERILSSGILSTINWELDDLKDGKWLHLEAKTKGYKPKAIFDLFSSYHGNLRLNRNLELVVSDGALYLRIDNIPSFLKFRKELNLKVELKGLSEKLEEYRLRYESLKSLMEELGETNQTYS